MTSKMNILLDTCTFLWIITNADELTEYIKGRFMDPENGFYLSAASSWEIGIKYSLGKLPLPDTPLNYIPNQREKHDIEELPISEEAVLQIPKLPDIHKDPFDRILICQSIMTGYPIMTPDSFIHKYPVKTIWG